MKRRNFLKGLAATVAVVTVAPLAIANSSNKNLCYDCKSKMTVNGVQIEFEGDVLSWCEKCKNKHLKKWEEEKKNEKSKN